MLAFGRVQRGALLSLLCCVGIGWLSAEEPTEAALRSRLESLTGQARLSPLLELANRLESRRPQEGLNLALEGVDLAHRTGDRPKEAAFLSTAAYCCTGTGDFKHAIEYGQAALALGTQLGDQDRMARAHNTLGIAYTFSGAYSQALDESLEALRIRERLGEPKAVDQSLNLIGIVYIHSGQYERAMDYFRQILGRTSAQPESRRVILAKHNLGFALYKLGRLDEALVCHEEALALAQRSGELTYLSYAYLNLGMVYSDLHRFKTAREYLDRAVKDYRKTEQKHGLVQALRATARLDLLTGAYPKGISLAKEGAALALKINARDELKECYELISDMYTRMGNTAESYRFFKLATEAKDLIYSTTESHKFAAASMKLETLKKDHEIEALKREQVISGLKLEKQHYITILLLSASGFLVTGVLVLVHFNRKTREQRRLLQRSNADLGRMNLELQDRMNEIKTLSGLLPICAHCKKIRDDAGYWNQLEGYISERTAATFSHGVCPHCAEAHYPEVFRKQPEPDAPDSAKS